MKSEHSSGQWHAASRDTSQSPCVDNCCLDEHDICLGCGRSITEIIGWNKSTESEKQAILALCRIRQKQRDDRLRERLGKQPD